VHIPIPQYPPYQLRSLLVKKYPVIWARFLDAYVRLCYVLIAGQVSLSPNSQNQFLHFVATYLAESSQDASRILSIGAVNSANTANTALLRAPVLQAVQTYGLARLELTDAARWHFVVVYVERNGSAVRDILRGTAGRISCDNANSSDSQLPLVRRYLLERLQDVDFLRDDLRTLAALLGLHAPAGASAEARSNVEHGGAKLRHNPAKLDSEPDSLGPNASAFAQAFVSPDWIEALEALYTGASETQAALLRDVAVVSILVLSGDSIDALVAALDLRSPKDTRRKPLLNSILVSDAYRRAVPGLETRIAFIHASETRNVPSDAVAALQDMFPHASTDAAAAVLRRYDNDVDRAANAVLEGDASLSPDAFSEGDASPERDIPVGICAAELERGIQRFSLKEHETTCALDRSEISAVEVKKKTLSRALSLLYDSDEDERDDTYDDALGAPGASGSDDDASHAAFDAAEMELFGYLKNEGEAVFERSSRKSAQRTAIRTATGWSDEQIEGWRRMLRRSLRRFRMLEEQYVVVNSNRALNGRKGGSYRRNSDSDEGDSDSDQRNPEQRNIAPDKRNNSGPGPSKNELARKTANKARVGNHGRKGRHSTKTRAELAGMQ
ncbi:hypothetical protein METBISCDRAFT_6397, partial [Metschnikowia bicuspidata]